MQHDETCHLDWEVQSEKEFRIPGIGVTISEQIFGALASHSDNPLSRVSVANASFSLDPFRGCPARCAYCTVAGAARDIEIIPAQDGRREQVLLPTIPEQLFSGEELVQALIRHPAFIKDKSVISIGTGSTEAFLPQVEEHTWRIMRAFLEGGYKNPFWIVTKMSIPDRLADAWCKRFTLLKNNGIEVVISVTYSGAPTWLEPFQGDRFRNIELMKRCGVRISHHLRPIILGVNDSEDCMRMALDASIGLAEVICVGGLRRDAGVEIAWQNVYNLDPSLLPPRSIRQKELPDGYLERVQAYIYSKKLGIPVVTRSSEAIAHLLTIPEYNLYKYRPDDDECFLYVPVEIQELIQLRHGKSLIEIIDQTANEIGLRAVQSKADGSTIFLGRKLAYQEHRALVHAIGHLGIFS